ncbi:MAG: hypothetical protein HYZ75_12110 [Elusimicrobia bacterium]|nr:hypothetical protein [Elusimicrobiota bacterium]
MTRALTLLAAVLLGAAPAGAQIGLATSFVEVSIDGLEPGRVHGLADFSELEYPVRNLGGKAVEALLKAERPARAAPFYEPIPDPAWIRFSSAALKLQPGASASAEVLIALPDDPRLFGRHFEASIWARTRGAGGLAAGVRSRLRFSVGPPPGAPEERAPRSLACLLGPEDVHVRRAKPAHRLSLRVASRESLPLELLVRAFPAPKVPRGFQPVEPSAWVIFKPARLRLAPKGSAVLELEWAAPAELRGRRVAFALRAEASDGRACPTRRVFLDLE